MYKMSLNYRQEVSMLLALTMIFSAWFVAVPPVQASFLRTVGNIGKALFVNVGALGIGAVGAALGAAVGGGPLGMGVGAVGGFFAGRKLLSWVTSSVGNFGMVAGAIAGGALTLGMGFPMMAVGIIGGGLLGRLATSLVSRLFGNKNPVLVSDTQINQAAAAQQDAAMRDFLSGLGGPTSSASALAASAPTAPAVPAGTAAGVTSSQVAYDKYVAAYKLYMDATTQGNPALAQQAYGEYRKYLDLYNSLIRAGR